MGPTGHASTRVVIITTRERLAGCSVVIITREARAGQWKEIPETTSYLAFRLTAVLSSNQIHLLGGSSGLDFPHGLARNEVAQRVLYRMINDEESL